MKITDINEIQAIKNRIAERWQVIDSKLNFANRIVTCGICNYSNAVNTFKKIIATCLFGGGTLERYYCPQCGVIFGPIKMFDLSDEEFNAEYEEIYSIYEEGDTSSNEIAAFNSMNPLKDKIYLDYGCGSVPRALIKLRDMGYNVYGYEPYSDSNYEFIIKDIRSLQKIKFDGIFSNNVIEHFRYPIDDLSFMKILLKPTIGLMAHATTNHVYAYEYSRFHLYFFTGNSINYLATNSGFNLINKTYSGDSCCYIMSLK